MSLAKPVRLIALLVLGAWIVFLYHTFGPEQILRGPEDPIDYTDADPSLSCMTASNKLVAL